MVTRAVCGIRQIYVQILDLFFTSCEMLGKTFQASLESLFPYGALKVWSLGPGHQHHVGAC